MSLTQSQQLIETMIGSTRPLIALKPNPSIDAVVSSLALANILKKHDKETDIISIEYECPENVAFLPYINTIQNNSDRLRTFLITLNTKDTKVADFSYTMTEDELQIYVTPKDKFWQPEDVKTGHAGWLNDLSFVLDASDLETLGDIFEHHAEFFYQTPIINIDHKPENESFGQINIVDVKASSVSEILFSVLSNWNQELIDEEVATLLLTGIISKTHSFRKTATPQTLNAASQLIALGADRAEIVKNLYQQKPLSTLRLWGRALARLKNDPQSKLVWSLIPYSDFEKARGKVEDLKNVIEELIANAPLAGIVVILYENNAGEVHGIARLLHNHYNLLEALRAYEPKGTADSVSFSLPSEIKLAQSEEHVIKRIQKNIRTQGA